MGTTKLYWDDPFALTFESEGASLEAWEGKPSLVLPATRFYPEAGGQLGDTGWLQIADARLDVVDTQIADDGTIHHILDRAPAAFETGPVLGEVLRERRRDHMAHHTAQHMLSAALMDVARAETVSSRLGSTSCTIDLDVPGVADRVLARAEDLVNGIVRDDVGVRAFFPSASELASLKLRRAPKVTEGIRLIDIEGFDLSPCGGTHCTRTGQVGVVRVVATEKYKGKVRISFHAAARAVVDMRAKEETLAALMADLTCGAQDLPTALAKLRSDLQKTRESLGKTRAELATKTADEALAIHPPLADGADTRIVLMTEGSDVAVLRALAGRLTGRPDVVAMCFAIEGDATDALVVVQRGAGAKLDCGAWLKEQAAAHGGRGGGRPERAEGRLPVSSVRRLAASPLSTYP